MEEKYTKAYQSIQEANHILLVTHHRPDGDALGSLCAMIDLVKTTGKKYSAFCFDSPPEQFNFLPHLEEIISAQDKFDFSLYDLIISTDCGSVKRTKIEDKIINRSKTQKYIEFDHHPKTDDYADIEIRQTDMSSTAEVIYNFYKTNHIKVNKSVANCLLTGIMTDTGNLLYPSTSTEAVKISSNLLKLGARFPTILKNTWRNKSLEAMKIWGKAMDRLTINKKYKIAFTILTHEDISKSGATEEEFEGISGFLSNISGANTLLFLREEEKGLVRGSLRGIHPKIDISHLARKIGGGGHAKASGFALEGNIKKVKTGWKIL